ncbi:molecular chaperone [Chlorella sorokiniana]|uniref:Molecular chaperone n=1 Tax=Chlorella sorokiniana TaxID=3076 RepID=A0A2P6TRW6_CHLSO|nr:molecular chaperone [Chlorella sorokiniana]|eukprot:PRW56798.1 molecular chaperone [Chlorella sorokiniana]
MACASRAAGWTPAVRPAAGRRAPPAARPAQLPPSRAVVGIDLGTSNSCVAVVSDGEARVLPAADGNSSVPSVVSFTQDSGSMLVGQEALDPVPRYQPARPAAKDGAQPQLRVSPADCFHSFKRLIGKKLEDVADEAARLTYAVGQGDRGEALVYSPTLDDMLSPEELSSFVLAHLKRQVEDVLGEPVTGAVVTVPAHFNQAQQGATHAAAQQAGIATVQLLQEPVAAALAYGINGGTDGDTVLVVDVGGGTFDVSVLQAFEGIMEVLGTAGDANLGGNDFDARLADWLEAECAAHGVAAPDHGARFVHEGQAHGWALEAAEAAKVALSRADAAEVALPGGASLALSRQQFEELTSELFQRMANVLEALGDALFIEWAVRPSDAVPGRPQGSNGSGSGSSGEQQQQQQDRWAPPPRRITQVALVGQLTRLPSVQQFVARCTGVQPRMTVDPAEAVALGAAIHAGVLLGELSGVELMDGSYSQDLHDRATGFSGWQP